jgi:hypothetical protein
VKHTEKNDREDHVAAGPVSHDEAQEILLRFNASHWDNGYEKARYSIPADPQRDDDIRLSAYIAQQRAKDERLHALERVDALFREHILAHGVEHDDSDCPEDDTCECANVAAINAALAATESRKEAPHAAPAKTPLSSVGHDGAVHTQETEPGAVGEAAPGEGTAERRAPMQGEHGRNKRPSGTITWSEHLEIYEVYAKRYGRDQSAERLAERGGFGWGECVMLLGREPATWKPEAGR